MISNKLLSELYDIEVSRIIELVDNNYEVTFANKKNGKWYNIVNIHELAHKCKEWAFDRGYTIWSTYQGYITLKPLNDSYGIEFEEDTEPEAIFKACEWILEQKK